MRRTSLLGIFFVLLLISAGGCGDRDDRNNPLMRKGDSCRLEGDLRGAELYYRRMLEKRPDSAAAHLAMATLCDEALERPEAALYHYDEYLRLMPPDSEDRPVAEGYRAAIREKLRNALSGDSPETLRLRAENTALRGRIDQLKQVIFQQHRRLNTVPAPVSVPTPAVAPESGNPGMTDAGTVFYTVRAGDTPGRIAHKFYGSASRYPLILEANNLKRSTGLRVGQVLKIPPQKTQE